VLPAVRAVVASPEDVIVSKLASYAEGQSDKHLADIAGILRLSAGRVEEPYIDSWITRLGLQEGWRASRRLADTGR
jgi:hypothetical protein